MARKKIRGIQGMTDVEVHQALLDGGRLVMFEYCISIIVMTFKRSSDIYFIPAEGSTLPRALPWIGLTLLLGWWGIPWGPIYTIGSTFTNFNGGHEVTEHFLQ